MRYAGAMGAGATTLTSSGPDSEDQEDQSGFSRVHVRYAGLGFELAAALALFCLVGNYVDQHFGIRPIGLISGAIVGLIAAGYHVGRAVIDLNRDDEDKGPH